MKNVYGYIRVSDQKQVDGASLSEQERIIGEYAVKNGLNILQWFRETKTAAKRGRPEFNKMIGLLCQGKADGVIIHKIDRSARNLHDWASVGDLIDRGIEVHFAHESLDMTERGGRLSADIQAVMASDYVRNLRQEALKGLYGRLKQGFYPFKAPIGYLDHGKAAVKTVDLKNSKLIVMVFELYVYENHTIASLVPIMKEHGLRNLRGNPLGKNSISKILNNPFYMGLMKVKGQIFEGSHEPIIPPRLYRQAQLKLKGNIRKVAPLHDYLFRGVLKCHLCSRSMIGELQKGMVYYRCHRKGCATKSVREDFLEQNVKNLLRQIAMSEGEQEGFEGILNERLLDKKSAEDELLQGIDLQLNDLVGKEQRLLDAYLENIIEKDELNRRRESFREKIEDLKYRRVRLGPENDNNLKVYGRMLELCKSPINMYNSATKEEKRMLVKMTVSNFTVNEKRVMISPLSPYSLIANRDILLLGGLQRDRPRNISPYMIYSDKNTSPILPKPLNREQMEKFIPVIMKEVTKMIENKPIDFHDYGP